MLTVMSSAPGGGGGAQSGPRPQDLQKLKELVNKFIVNTAHLMNAFATTCEERLAVASRQLHRVECHVSLLEYKLDSIDRVASSDDDSGPKGAVASSPGRGGADGSAPAITAGPGGAAGRAGARYPVPRRGGKNVPAMPDKGAKGAPPPPGSGGPPLPPGIEAAPPPPPPIAPGAPPLLAAPPPPPPMPVTAGLTIRTHPRLAGYFRMAQAGVAAVAIKAKMRADGHNPDWFDTPDAPSPLPAVKPNANEFDSD